MPHLLTLLLLTLALGSAPAISSEPRLNIDYTTFDAPAELRGPKKITVVHYFSYYCYLCAESAPAIRAWLAKLPEDVQVLVPITDQRGRYPDLNTHIALDRMGKTATIDPLIYDLIHRGKSGFADAPTMRAWLAKQGIDEAALDAEMKAFSYVGALQTSRRWGAAFMQSSATLIPQIAIDGRYLVRYAQVGLSNAPKERDRQIAKHLAVMDTLIERVRQERLAAAQ